MAKARATPQTPRKFHGRQVKSANVKEGWETRLVSAGAGSAASATRLGKSRHDVRLIRCRPPKPQSHCTPSRICLKVPPVSLRPFNSPVMIGRI